jgi:lipid-A-disaccharide synthase-like uncharacterized protein
MSMLSALMVRAGRSWVSWSLVGAQVALAAIFVFAGGFKLALPAAELAEQSALPVLFMRFIGTCELLGGLAMVLPALGGRRSVLALVPIAAAGVVVIMAGAVVVTIVVGPPAGAVVPFAVGCLAAYVLASRRHWLVALR